MSNKPSTSKSESSITLQDFISNDGSQGSIDNNASQSDFTRKTAAPIVIISVPDIIAPSCICFPNEGSWGLEEKYKFYCKSNFCKQ